MLKVACAQPLLWRHRFITDSPSATSPDLNVGSSSSGGPVWFELPDRLETREWVALEGAAMRAYRKAVLEGNFMAMRRAAFGPRTVKGSLDWPIWPAYIS